VEVLEEQNYRSQKAVPYLLLTPTMLILILFLYWPSLQSIYLSFYQQAPFGRKKIFNGLGNYFNLFQDSNYLMSIFRSTIFTLITIVLGLFLALILSILLNQDLKGIKFYRVVFFIPYAISATVAGSLWVFILNPVAGQVNYLLDLFFNLQISWLTNTFFAFLAVIMATIWKNIGFNIIFFLAGLQSIPESIYESARIDGANSLTIFRQITVPLLSPTTFYLIIMNIIFSVFESFGIIDIMTQGGPANSTNILIYKLYREMFINFRPGSAAAQTVVLLILVIIVTILHFKYGNNKVHYQ
jgi:sn-glycerol 3-phosphate transport system permease protein